MAPHRAEAFRVQEGGGTQCVRISTPVGLPTKRSHELVIQGNACMKLMARVARAQQRAGGWWSIEHPHTSIVWKTKALKALARKPKVTFIRGDQCVFGAPSVKPTGWLTNAPFLRVLERCCPGAPEHVGHVRLEGRTKDEEGHWVARTALAAAYPTELCKALAT